MNAELPNGSSGGGSSPVEVFISYAHKDEALRRKLDTHLSLMQRQGLIARWHDRHIQAGMNWAKEIDTRLEAAVVILLLISADFVASDYCYGIEMKRALERHEADQALVIPIILRPVDWTTAPFAHVQALPTGGKAITSWKNRDEAFADVTAGIRRALSIAPTHRSSSLPLASFPPIWNVPYPRNVLFTGREDLLTQLAASLRTGQPTALSQPPRDVQPQAISGLGGIGKTQVALEYTYRSRGEYQAVLWAQAETQEALTSSYLTFATLLDLPEKNAQESAQVIAAVKQWLQRTTGYVLILDNADDLSLARDFLPPSMGGHVVLTTRAQATGRFARRLEVETLPVEQGVEFLLRRAGVLSADADIKQISEADRKMAKEICEEVGGLPLALDQAGAYIEETGCGLAGYVKRYRQQRGKVLAQRRGPLVDDHPLPVASTWALSFEQVEQRSAAGADVLRMCAFLAPDGIPECILTEGGLHLGAALATLKTDETMLDEALEALRAYSLVKRDAATHTLSVHRLVQAVLKDQMEEESQKEWMSRAVQAVNVAFPSVEHKNWSVCEQMLPHALVCRDLIEQYEIRVPQAADLLQATGMYLIERVRYREAERVLQQTRSLREETLGQEHPKTAATLDRLGRVYEQQGHYAKAEPLYQRALAICEQQLGALHPDTAGSLNNLANLYEDQGKYAEAEPLYQRALAICEQQLGALHPDTATSFNELARLYKQQGKYEEAKSLYQRALAIYEQQLGAQHPWTATALNNLAGLYKAQGKYSEAEPLYQRAMAIREQQLGAEHPDTAQSLNNLAELYREQGKYAEVEPLLQRALAINEQVYGTEHPSIATSLNNLASLYYAQGKYAEAEPLYERALTIREQQLGALHPWTATSLNNLAGLYYAQGKYVEAEPLYQRAVVILEQVLGDKHPNTRAGRRNYAELLRAMGRSQKAEALEAKNSAGS